MCKPVLHFWGHVHREVDATSAFRDVFCLMGTSEPPNPFRGARFANHTFDTRRARRARPLGFRHAPGFMSQLFWDAFVGDWLQTLTACAAHHDNSERLEAHKHREQPRSSARERSAHRVATSLQSLFTRRRQAAPRTRFLPLSPQRCRAYHLLPRNRHRPGQATRRRRELYSKCQRVPNCAR